MMTGKQSTKQSTTNERGFTLVEIVVVLAVIALLSAVLGPMAVKYVRDARIAKVQADVKMIGVAIQQLETDVNHYPYHSAGNATTIRDQDANVSVLESAGDMPHEVLASAWTASTGAGGACEGTPNRNDLESPLITNASAWPTVSSAARPGAWKGPYLHQLTADAWGNKYLVNIINAKRDCAKAAFVLSAGPNGIVETAFDIGRDTVVVPGVDDIIYRIK